jgi:hypothetical protein
MAAVVFGGCQYQKLKIKIMSFCLMKMFLPQVAIPDCVISLDIDIKPHADKRIFRFTLFQNNFDFL